VRMQMRIRNAVPKYPWSAAASMLAGPNTLALAFDDQGRTVSGINCVIMTASVSFSAKYILHRVIAALITRSNGIYNIVA
jgi:hypothetical protein